MNSSSDTSLFSLCHDEGISLKCTDGQLVLFDQSVYEALPPVATIRESGGRILPAAPEAHGAYSRDQSCLAYESYDLSTGAAETQYGSCRVKSCPAAVEEARLAELVTGPAEGTKTPAAEAPAGRPTP